MTTSRRDWRPCSDASHYVVDIMMVNWRKHDKYYQQLNEASYGEVYTGICLFGTGADDSERERERKRERERESVCVCILFQVA